jgi:hypothetical protein
MHRFQSTGFTDLLLEYLDVNGAIESEQSFIHQTKFFAIENVILSSLIRSKSKPLKLELKGKRQMLNRQSRNMEIFLTNNTLVNMVLTRKRSFSNI